jgi:hypothetical protein
MWWQQWWQQVTVIVGTSASIRIRLIKIKLRKKNAQWDSRCRQLLVTGSDGSDG